jgi:ferredoxin
VAYKISEDCVSCGSCESACSNKTIKQGKNQYVIDAEKCTECVGTGKKPQCAKVCPMEAPKPDSAHVETKEQLLAKWQKLHPGETPKA